LRCHDYFGSPATSDYLTIRSREYTTTTQRPYVNVTYEPPAPGYYITNLPDNVSVVLNNDTGVLLNDTSQVGIVNALIKRTGKNKYGALVSLNFSDDIDLKGLVVDIDSDNRKSVVHNYSSFDSIVNVSLLVPRVTNSGGVFICPNAETIYQVNTTCLGLVNISVGQTVNGMTVSEVTYDSKDYYLVSNITGTGGGEPDVTNLLQCVFIQSTTCPAGTAKLIGVKNDTGGFNNAHAQNNTLNTYDYSLCCNSTNASIAISATCPGNDTVIRLSNYSNAHVELGNLSTYSNLTCLGSNWKKVNCEYPQGSCAANYACIMSIAGSEGTNTTNAHLGSCSSYDQKICCALTNRAPAQPTLYYPADNNNTVFERRPNFNWSAAADPDGGFATYYTINITCGGGSCSCYQPKVNVSTTNYTIPNPLCFSPVSYNWTVTACDAYGDCNTSTTFHFTISSQANLVLLVNLTNFTNMTVGQNNNTLGRSPTQLVAQNIGNVRLNVTINASALFTSAGMNTFYYQYAASVNKTNSFTSSCSQTTFANMNLSASNLFCNLTYENNTGLTNNTGNIELNITVPNAEPPGTKTSNIVVGFYTLE
jgi:hypothetical protein